MRRGFSGKVLNTVAAVNVDPTEMSLVDRAAAGDAPARAELFARHRDVAFRVALRVTGRREDALDAVQDAFIRAFDRLGDFQRTARFQTWLLRIVTNRALDVVRARRVRQTLSIHAQADEPAIELPAEPEDTTPSRGLEQQELAARLQAAIDTLPEEQRSVFAMYAAGELTYGAIAEALGIPIGTVMSRLYHARRKLQGVLGALRD